jgi:hypothetical protein
MQFTGSMLCLDEVGSQVLPSMSLETTYEQHRPTGVKQAGATNKVEKRKDYISN